MLKILKIVSVFSFVTISTFARDNKKEVLSLSKGKYVETFDQDSIEQIGNIIYNVNSRQIIGFVTLKETNAAVALKPEIISRWLSIDPHAAKYPSISPYSFALDNPIAFNDPDGRDVKIHVGNIPVGTTKINLFSAGEIKQNAALAKYTVTVPVYKVDVSNESGSTANYYFTRISYRGDKEGNVNNVTFDVRKDGDEFKGVIKSRWGQRNNVLELRDPNNVNNQTIKGMRDDVNADRTAIQFHVKGASDGCLLCTGSDQFGTKDKSVDETNLKGNSKQTQAGFMKTIQNFQKEDKDNGKGTDINVQFDKNTSNDIPNAPTNVALPQK